MVGAVSKTVLDGLVAEGWINATKSGPLTLYNYSNKTVFAGEWNQYTLAARGLVMDEVGRVLARPWPKFFNLGERPGVALPAETPELARKYDGSLVIVFHDGERWRCCTRGCWENVQTDYGMRWLERHSGKLHKDLTYLFELIAPWNRIVVHYPKDDMVLLGIVDTEGGSDWSYAATRDAALTHDLTPLEFETRPLESVNLEDPSIKNEEGFVARFSNGFRVKLKYKQYLYLHKIITGLSVKGIWEILSSGNAPDFSNVPDEFHGWYRKQEAKIREDYARLECGAKAVFHGTPKLDSRKDYAAVFTQHKELSGVLFRMLDGRPYSDLLWKQVKPSVHEVFKNDEI